MSKCRVIIVMPAYNVGLVIGKTLASIPVGTYEKIIVVDDGSSDHTAEAAAKAGATVVRHPANRGYGAAQKTGYKKALEMGVDIVVLVHGDNQYDPAFVPQFVSKILAEGCDLVTGTRMKLGDALQRGMPVWKFIPNRLLTVLENCVFGSCISDYHNGFRAYTAKFLKEIPLDLLSDKFDFDTDIIVQGTIRKYKIGEVAHPTRYSRENSQMPFGKAVVYGLSILRTVAIFVLYKMGVCKQKIFSLEEKCHE